MDDNMLVSVIVTSFGLPKGLKRAIDSVLSQTYSPIEIIVVDDNNPDSIYRTQTELVMGQYISNPMIKYIRHDRNMNGAVARNTGIDQAVGEYIAFLDNDDVYLSERIESSLKYLEDNPLFGGVVTSVILAEDRIPIKKVTPNVDGKLSWRLLCGTESIGTGSNLFFRKSVVKNIGYFDTNFLRYQDMEFFLRVCQKYNIGLITDYIIISN